MIYFRLTRPFTLLPPMLGMISGAVSAWGAGAASGSEETGQLLWFMVLGALMAATLNAASNVLNQVHDLELDRINKPWRPLPAEEVSVRAATLTAYFLYAVAIALAFAIVPGDYPEVGLMVVVTAILTWAYSGPPLRLRRSWWLAPLVIALPRGALLKVCGWASVAPVANDPEPWVLGAVFFIFVLGVSSTKDFSDMEGDRAGGVVTLPLRFGPKRAAWLMAPFYVLPWIAVAILPWIEIGGKPGLSVDPVAATALGLALAIHGLITAKALIHHADNLVDNLRGRIAWVNLYLLMMEAQIGIAVLYWFYPNAVFL